MTRKDFELIAEVLAERREAMGAEGYVSDSTLEHQIITEAFAGKLAETNPLFDRDRFINAAEGK